MLLVYRDDQTCCIQEKNGGPWWQGFPRANAEELLTNTRKAELAATISTTLGGEVASSSPIAAVQRMENPPDFSSKTGWASSILPGREIVGGGPELDVKGYACVRTAYQLFSKGLGENARTHHGNAVFRSDCPDNICEFECLVRRNRFHEPVGYAPCHDLHYATLHDQAGGDFAAGHKALPGATLVYPGWYIPDDGGDLPLETKGAMTVHRGEEVIVPRTEKLFSEYRSPWDLLLWLANKSWAHPNADAVMEGAWIKTSLTGTDGAGGVPYNLQIGDQFTFELIIPDGPILTLTHGVVGEE